MPNAATPQVPSSQAVSHPQAVANAVKSVPANPRNSVFASLVGQNLAARGAVALQGFNGTPAGAHRGRKQTGPDDAAPGAPAAGAPAAGRHDKAASLVPAPIVLAPVPTLLVPPGAVALPAPIAPSPKPVPSAVGAPKTAAAAPVAHAPAAVEKAVLVAAAPVAPAAAASPTGADSAPTPAGLGAILPVQGGAGPVESKPGPVTTAATPPLASPAAQVAHGMSEMSAAIGTHRVVVQLTPTELGRVTISIVRDAAGAATVSVTAERAETLALVRADATQLHAALDQAGIGAHGRSVEFHLADQPTGVLAAAAHAAPRTVHDAAGTDLGADRGFGGAQTGAGTGNDGRPAPQGGRPLTLDAAADDDAAETARNVQPPPALRTLLRAVDFTA